MRDNKEKILVIGAYGYTAKLICAQLNDLSIDFDIAGKDQEALNGLKMDFSHIGKAIKLDISQKEEFSCLEEYHLIVNCVGPYQLYSKKLLEYCINGAKIYFDICGEVEFVENSMINLNELAKNKGSLVIHGLAFESAIADIFGMNLLNNGNADALYSYYDLGETRVSPGTRFTMKLSKFRNNYILIDGNKVLIRNLDASSINKVELSDGRLFYTLPYPLPEISWFANRGSLKNVSSYYLTDEYTAKRAFVKDENKEEMASIISKMTRRKLKGPTKEQREAQQFELIVRTYYDGRISGERSAQGNDMYLASAKVMAFAVSIICEQQPDLIGVMSPYNLLNGKEKELFNFLGIEQGIG